MTSRRAAVVHLGRHEAMGERRRTQSWIELLRGAEAVVDEIPLLVDHQRKMPLPGLSELGSLMRRESVLETAAWDVAGAADRLRRCAPDLVVFVSARAYHRRLAGIAAVNALDFVDSLSRAYTDRAHIVRGMASRVSFRVLASNHRGFERRARERALRLFAAGWQDARSLHADWLPIPVASMDRINEDAADHDLLFFGTLAYPPNVAAIRRLGKLWPALRMQRPDITLLVGGARPTHEVRGIAAAHGWDLIPDFPDIKALCARARLAVVPLDHAAGIQIKVLESAAAGLAQVVSPAALGGMAPGFPAAVAATDAEFVQRVVQLLDDEPSRQRLSRSAWSHVRELYSIERWIPAVSRLFAAGSFTDVAPDLDAMIPAGG